MSILREFRAFLFRGNIVELAVAFVIGVAFVALVNALVADLITPIIAAIIGKPDFGDLTFTIHESVFRYGDFINAVITFVAVAAAVFFFVVKPMELITTRLRKDEAPTTRECPECLSVIPVAARRCSHCTTEVAPAL
jgi:large conductance mechanosensitive channel